MADENQTDRAHRRTPLEALDDLLTALEHYNSTLLTYDGPRKTQAPLRFLAAATALHVIVPPSVTCAALHDAILTHQADHLLGERDDYPVVRGGRRCQTVNCWRHAEDGPYCFDCWRGTNT